MNEFVDMHVHSKFSIDGMSTMEDYCLIAGKTGTRVICFTEHVDFNSAEKNLSIVKDNRKQNFVVDDYFREINRLRKKAMLKKGIISEEEFTKIDTMLLEKYKPTLSTLLSGNPLI